jgi:thiol-disulfide isomerase/thioredoxin
MAVIETNDTDFSEIISSNDSVIIKYFADWCGTCKLFAPKFKRLSEDERFNGVVFVEINAEKNPDARKAGNVKNLPTFVAFKDGVLLDSVAAAKEETIIELISKLK